MGRRAGRIWIWRRSGRIEGFPSSFYLFALGSGLGVQVHWVPGQVDRLLLGYSGVFVRQCKAHRVLGAAGHAGLGGSGYRTTNTRWIDVARIMDRYADCGLAALLNERRAIMHRIASSSRTRPRLMSYSYAQLLKCVWADLQIVTRA